MSMLHTSSVGDQIDTGCSPVPRDYNLACRTSPIYKLPFEILLLIFDFYIDSVGYMDMGRNPLYGIFLRGLGGPWLLSAVCGRWRDVLICRPKYWTNIRFVLRYRSAASTTQKQSRYVNMIPLQLSRSQNLPLSIHLTLEQEALQTMPIPGNSNAFRTWMSWGRRKQQYLELNPCEFGILSQLLLQCQRWKAFVLVDRSDSDHGLLYTTLRNFAPSPIECPMLEHVDVDVSSAQTWFASALSQHSALFAHRGSPSLRSAKLKFDLDYNDTDRPSPRFPWEQLEYVSLEKLERFEDFLFDAGHKLTNLKTMEIIDCDLENRDAVPTYAPPETMVTLPMLETFRAFNGCPVFALHMMRTPSLVDVTIERLDDENLPSLISLIDRSSCSIQSFRCSVDIIDNPEQIITLLGRMDTLQDLVMNLAPCVLDINLDLLTEALNHTDSQTGSFKYCPHLRHLSAYGRPYGRNAPPAPNMPMFLDMLERRLSSPEASFPGRADLGLRVVELFPDKGWKIADGISSKISRLKERGVDIIFRGGEEVDELLRTRSYDSHLLY